MTQHEKELLSYRDLETLGYGSRVTIWRKVKTNEFPSPIDRYGKPAWLREDIEAWKNSRPYINTATA